MSYIMLGVCESVNNAISHGNNYDESKFVSILARVNSESIVFEIHDEGEGFDPDSVPDPTLEMHIKNEGGRGLFIIKNLSDEINFRNNGSVIQLKFNIKSGHSVSPWRCKAIEAWTS